MCQMAAVDDAYGRVFLPLFSSSAHMLLNRVSKLGLLGAFDDPGRLSVDDEAVKQPWKTQSLTPILGEEYFTTSKM